MAPRSPAHVTTATSGAKPEAAPGAQGCQWIEGEPSADDRCKCGAPRVAGSAYCPEHYARTVTARQPRSVAVRDLP